ncbi:alcohol dehydrogenase catalytic domain-containing protein [Jannaschia sp. S6380]|uniref:alcohol dehydrogenase catalytic domain-containing protein n=1 Tax=Jannaschia sp. S6380 TaxID=2926408 RepID=UPI001FF2D97F|nr:alcohol dehydrogenase catalytic domain-containing protein [Jannaschia sp. S6380]MCK0168796.1 alcohol dehydrogenase catalytic domain-containing protein [Jannaschia sp. S6380]
MQAITFPERGRVAFGPRDRRVAGDGEAVIRVMASGLCHTDFEVLKANYGTGAFPVTPGHEFAGIVTQVGPGVDGLTEGDRVVVDPNIECGRCRACRRGHAHLCETLGAYGVTRDGGFAEFCILRAGALHPIGDLPFGRAALAEPMGCVLNALGAVHDAKVERALIFGAGPMGLLMALAMHMRGTADITFVDTDEARVELARGFGFAALAADAGELTAHRRAADLAIDATGVPAVAAGLTDYVADGGGALYFGICPVEGRIEISPFEVFRRQLTLAGTHSLNHNIPDALRAIDACGEPLDRIVSHRLPLAEMHPILSGGPPRGSLKIQAVAD